MPSKRTEKAAEDARKLREKILQANKEPAETETKETTETNTETPAVEETIIKEETKEETVVEPEETIAKPEETVVETVVTEEETAEEIPAKKDRKEDEETYKSRYDTIKGKYDVEISRVFAANKVLQDRLDEIEANELKRKEEEKKEAEEVKPDISKFISAEDTSTWGADLANFVVNTARSVVSDFMTNEFSKVAPIADRFDTMKRAEEVTLGKVFDIEMKTAIPDWKIINKDPEFAEWLKQPDGVSGIKTRFESAKECLDNLDSEHLSKIFLTFKEEKNKTIKSIEIAEPLKEEKVISKPPVQKETMSRTAKINISPGKSKTSQQVVVEEPTKITISDLEKAGNDLSRATSPQERKVAAERLTKIRAQFIKDNKKELGGG